ncbi:hypothetical protein [Neoroseomonas rubea]|uniref:hypothetical protein n=1 Tax=Neoroseomonas rubea TaxID=2748666 RepID=UPI0018E0586A|nr:hypothetical protein [Roseomonas rubea]
MHASGRAISFRKTPGGRHISPFNFLRRGKSPDPEAFAVFLRRQAAFVAQKTVIDYCRVKAGRRERQLFADPDFAVALRHCRWQVYLAALADVVVLAEAWLRPHAAGQEAALADALVRMHDAALAAEPPPEEERPAAEAARLAFPTHLAASQQAAPVSAHRMALLSDAPLFATLPVHADQRVGETPAIRGALRFHIVATQQEMERLFDPAKLAAGLMT